MPYINLDISYFSIFRAPLGLLEMPYIDLDISHLSSTRAPLLYSKFRYGLFLSFERPLKSVHRESCDRALREYGNRIQLLVQNTPEKLDDYCVLLCIQENYTCVSGGCSRNVYQSPLSELAALKQRQHTCIQT